MSCGVIVYLCLLGSKMLQWCGLNYLSVLVSFELTMQRVYSHHMNTSRTFNVSQKVVEMMW